MSAPQSGPITYREFKALPVEQQAEMPQEMRMGLYSGYIRLRALRPLLAAAAFGISSFSAGSMLHQWSSNAHSHYYTVVNPGVPHRFYAATSLVSLACTFIVPLIGLNQGLFLHNKRIHEGLEETRDTETKIQQHVSAKFSAAAARERT